MRIYLNTRSFERDYQWFSLDEDNGISVSKNYWESKEFSKLPIIDGFGIVLGKFVNNEYYLLVMDIDSGRIDNKNRAIGTSFLFVTEDEVILRKLTTLFLFDYEELVEAINNSIEDFPNSDFGFSTEYSQIINIIKFFVDKYEVNFAFDTDINEKRFCHFAELYLSINTTDENGHPVVEYKLNPVFETKLQRFLLSEIFPENFSTLFAYFPNLSLIDIEKGEMYLSVARELDKQARSIFLKDAEEWAKIELKEKISDKVGGTFNKYKTEAVVSAIAMFLILPFSYSYINMYSEHSKFEAEQKLFDSKINDLNRDINKYINKIDKLTNDLKDRNDSIASLKLELEDLKSRSNKNKVVPIIVHKENTNTENINNDQKLNQCLSDLKNEQKQKNDFLRKFRFYKKEYDACSGVE